MWYQLQSIPEGERGTDETVRAMVGAVERSLRAPDLRLLALRIIQAAGVPDRNPVGQARAIFDWITNNIHYVKDALGVEVVQQPEVTVKLRAGDCDDHTTLVAALARSIGLPVRIKTIGSTKDTFRHVFPEVFTGREWLPVDTTAQRPFGSKLPDLGAEKIYTFRGASKAMAKVRRSPGVRLSRVGTRKAISAAVSRVLHDNWSNGLIDRNDLDDYVKVIDQKNTPFANNALIEPTIRAAITDFRNKIRKFNMPSYKPAGTVSGLEGLDGFLKSIWNAAKSVVKGAVNLVTGGGSSTVKVEVAPQTPSAPAAPLAIKTPTTVYTAPIPAAVTPPVVYQPPPTTATDIFQSPYLWIGAGALLLILLTRRK